jgi:hypothetical protein
MFAFCNCFYLLIFLTACVQVNGAQVQIPYKQSDKFKISYDGRRVQYDTPFGLSVSFDGFWTIVVSVPDSYAGKMCGMCGNNDGDPSNDMTMKNGIFVGDMVNGKTLFGNSWIVNDTENPNPDGYYSSSNSRRHGIRRKVKQTG